MIILKKAIPARLSCNWFQKERANAVGFPWSMYVFLLSILIIWSIFPADEFDENHLVTVYLLTVTSCG
jgi:hypothetical protein